MKLVIEIDEETYKYWKEHKCEYVLAEAIANATPLPKGHGRLIDAGALLMDFVFANNKSAGECVYDAPTIIDADKVTARRGVFLEDVLSLPSVNPTTDLSKIRAEIIDKYMTADGRMGSVSADILKIIDKYSKGGDSDA